MDIAVIGMSGRFPEAKNLKEFYKNLKSGRDSVRKLSAERLRNTSAALDADYQVMGYLEDIDLFDHKFFNISLVEAQHIDPHQRLILEVVYETFENAGYNIDFFNGSNTSLFVGDVHLEYYKLAEKFDPTLITGNLNALLAGRISRFFNLQGSAQMIDTSCSSSLVALNLACNELIQGDSDYALVCGLKLSIFPIQKNNHYGNVGILAPDGKAKSFAAGANGTGGGEVLGCILLKSLDKAKEDKDIIHCVIKSVAVNQDANLSGSLTAPSSLAQSKVIRKAWAKGKVNPEKISFIETHGTGTKLGDPIEIQGIDQAFAEFTSKKRFCAISSLKTNIGHTGHAAGISSVIKTILSLKNKVLFPSLHFDEPNPLIDFENSVCFVNNTFKEWKLENESDVRIAGVSSFGLSGTNAHAVLEEFVGEGTFERSFHSEEEAYLITLSAKSEYSLFKYYEELKEYVQESEAPLKNITFTLNSGRKGYNFRFASIVENKDQLMNLDLSTYKQTEEISKLIFVFSDHNLISSKLIEKLCHQYACFNTYYTECLQNLTATTHNFICFAFQFAFYKLLGSKGIATKYLVGEGVGKIVIAYITGQFTIEKVIENLYVYTYKESVDFEKKCKMLLDSFSGEKVVFAEVGPLGNISREIEKYHKAESNFNLIKLEERPDNNFLHFVRNIYLNGFHLNWKEYYSEEKLQKVELPTYQFHPTRCWIKEPEEKDIKDWLYEITWKEAPLSNQVLEIKNKFFLVFEDKEGLSDKITSALSSNNKIIQVTEASSFKKNSDSSYQIDFSNEDDYIKLKNELGFDSNNLDGIIHTTTYSNQPFSVFDDVNLSLTAGVYSQFYISKVFAANFTKKGFRYIFITSNAFKTTQADVSVNSFNAAAMGYLRGIQSDNLSLKAFGLDINYRKEIHTEDLSIVLSEIFSDASIRFVSLRDRKKYVPVMEKLNKAGLKTDWQGLKKEGVYIVTGGASGIALEICRFIGKKEKSTFIILGRTSLPISKGEISLEPTSEIVRERLLALESLEKIGSTIDYITVDVGDTLEMEKVVASIKSKYKKVNGIIHSAGIGILRKPMVEKCKAEISSMLHAKVEGAINLAKHCQDLNPEFFILFSSLNACIPQKNSSDYAAANAFLDSLAYYLNEKKISCTSINWPGWKETGMAFRRGVKDDNSILRAITTSDGISAFAQILGIENPNVLVAEIDLNELKDNPFLLIGEQKDTLNNKTEMLAHSSVHDVEIKNLINEEFSDTELLLLRIWHEVLGFGKISKEEDFFEIGGHSLNGLQVLNRIKKEFGLNFEIETLFDYPTIKDLSAFIEASLGQPSNISSTTIIKPLPKQESYDVSHAQKRQWVIDQVEGGSLAYNMFKPIELHGKLDVEIFERAFLELVHRHEALRTVFVTINGELKQTIKNVEDFPAIFLFKDLREVNEKQICINQEVISEATTLFDLGKGPLFRVKLFRLEDEKYVFLFNIHHIITDGWSNTILLREFIILYNAFKKGNPNPLNPLPLQYKDYIAWQKELLEEQSYHKSYWLNQLQGQIPAINLQSHLPRPSNRSFRGGNLTFYIDEIQAEKLRAFNKTQEVTMFMSLVAIVNLLLYKYSSSEDIIIGSPISDRGNKEIESQVGFYINNLVLRSKISGKQSFVDFLKKTKQLVLDAFAHKIYPFDKLVEDLEVTYSRSRNPLYDILIVLNNYEDLDDGLRSFNELDGIVEFKNLESENISSKLDLTLFFTESTGIQVGVEYSTDLFSPEFIQHFSTNLQLLIAGLVDNPNLSLDELKGFLLNEEERKEHKSFTQSTMGILEEDF